MGICRQCRSAVGADASAVNGEASDYEPYGLPRSTWQKYAGLDSLIRHRYTDQEYDDETKLYNYNARLYDPSIARFISPDTIVQSPYSSIGLNRYMYVAGNPLRYTDPSGHLTLKKLGKAFATGLVAGVLISNPFLAGMAAGALNGFLSGGGLQGMFIGGTIGAITGSFGAAGYSGLANAIGPGMAAGVMLGAGAAAAYAQGGWNGVGYFAAGVAGGMTGASWANSNKDVGGTRAYNKAPRNPRHLSNNADGVEITFDKGADNAVDEVGANQFEDALRQTRADNPDFDSINISATTNAHPCPSSHCNGYAIDANRINGIRMADGYGSNPTVTRIVNSLQTNLSSAGSFYDNLGPSQMNAPYSISNSLRLQHTNHIHYSWGF